MISTKDLYWIAGILEGEGSFTVAAKIKPRITLNMTDKDIVERVRNILDQNQVVHKYYPKGQIGYKPIYNIDMTGPKAAGWMLTLFSIMGKRRQTRIKDIFSNWLLIKPKDKTRCKRGHTFSTINNRGNSVCGVCKSLRYYKSKAKKELVTV